MIASLLQLGDFRFLSPRKKLARRLLFDKSANDEHERSILTKLKQQCGGQFTSKMEGMVCHPDYYAVFEALFSRDVLLLFLQVTDLTLARENQASFEEYLSNNPAANPGIDLTVTVLTTGFWPSYKSFDLNLPAEMVYHFNLLVGIVQLIYLGFLEQHVTETFSAALLSG